MTVASNRDWLCCLAAAARYGSYEVLGIYASPFGIHSKGVSMVRHEHRVVAPVN